MAAKAIHIANTGRRYSGEKSLDTGNCTFCEVSLLSCVHGSVIRNVLAIDSNCSCCFDPPFKTIKSIDSGSHLITATRQMSVRIPPEMKTECQP